MTKVIIIEDEVNSQELLQAILEDNYKELKVVGIADSVLSGVALIKRTEPDIIFLDIEIQGGSGFDVISAFEQPRFRVIFVTGYDHYALRAIKYSALDYILKPINLEELDTAISKINNSINSRQHESLSFLNEQLTKTPYEINQFVISDHSGHRVLKFDDILFINSNRAYVTFHLSNMRKHIVTNPLNYYESILPHETFFRIHNSYLVNISKVIRIDSGRGGNLHLEGEHELPIAYRRKASLLKKIKQRPRP